MAAKSLLTGGKPVIGLTLGDAAGVGPEVVAAALASGQLDEKFEYRVLGSQPEQVIPGKPSAESAHAAWQGLDEAARGALTGDFAAVVTAPVCKASLYEIGFRYPGQTEFFADRCGIKNFAMLLTGGALSVALLTTHLPLAQAVAQISRPEIVRVGCLFADFLALRLGRPARIAVAGLNPHAGEGEPWDARKSTTSRRPSLNFQIPTVKCGRSLPDPFPRTPCSTKRRPADGMEFCACITTRD